MKKTFSFLIVLFIAANFSLAQNSKIHPYLQGVMNNSADNELIPVYILFNDHMTLNDFDDIGYDTPKKERRRIVIERLQNFAGNYQRDVKQFLDQKLVDRGIDFYEVLWINNTIRLNATTVVINDLATDYNNVQMVCYDPVFPEEMLLDEQLSHPPFNNAIQETDISSPIPQPGLTLINADDCWALGNTGEGVLTGNADNGFQWRHQDLVHQMWQNLGEDANNNGYTIIINSGLSSTWDAGDLNGIDDDGNGKIDDLIGWDFTTNNYNITSSSHGTSTMGIVVGDGTMGTQTGVAPDAKGIPLRNSSGETQQWAAFQYAVLMGAEVITSSLSWKWYFSPRPNYSAMRLITDMSLAAGTIHSNSTSNDGNSVGIPNNISTAGNCPPPWLHPEQTLVGNVSGVVGVGNVYASSDLIVSSSPYGPSYWGNWAMWGTYTYPIDPNHSDYPYSRVAPVEPDSMGLLKPDVSAPGNGTTSTSTSGGYSSFSGTSGATPHVCGTIALMLSNNPEMLPSDISKVLELTSVEKGAPGKDNRYGAGRIDALAATTSPKFTLEGIAGGSNMFINNTITPSDTARELVGLKISTNVNPKVGSLKFLQFGMLTTATSSHITSFDLYWDVDNSGLVSTGDIKLKSLPFTTGPLTFDTLKFKFLDNVRTVILTARTTAAASGQTLTLNITDTNKVIAYYTTRPFSTNFPFVTVSGVGNTSTQTLTYALSQNYPNPFNPTTIIGYTVAKNSFVSIKVYDVLGKEVATLMNKQKDAGNYQVEFDTQDHPGISSGIYYYKMTAGEFSDIKKMILLK